MPKIEHAVTVLMWKCVVSTEYLRTSNRNSILAHSSTAVTNHRMFHQYRIHSTKSNLSFTSIVCLHYWCEWCERNNFKIKTLSSSVAVVVVDCCICIHVGIHIVCVWHDVFIGIFHNFVSNNFRFRCNCLFWQREWLYLPLFALAKWTSRYTYVSLMQTHSHTLVVAIAAAVVNKVNVLGNVWLRN